MSAAVLIVFSLAVFAYAIGARRLSRTPVTAPPLFLALGVALHAAGLAGTEAPGLRAPLEWLAEATLALVLFSDAARTDARALLRRPVWPLRMLGLGLPLAIGLGAGAALLLLPGWPVWEAAALAALLAPTDAALAQPLIADRRVPERLREALTVEAGLNDGLALPAVLVFASLAAGAAGLAGGGAQDAAGWLGFLAAQIGLGVAAGTTAGLGGGRALEHACRRDWLDERTEGVAALAVAALAGFGAEALGGNIFVACFAAGLAFSLRLGAPEAGEPPHRARRFAADFLENEGQLLILAAFVLIGAELLPPALDRVGAGALALLLLSLFVIRPLAIWLSLIGTDAPPRARLFLGWFGPRGLATALFALLAVDVGALERGGEILAAAAAAVAVSALLHGVSAAPAAARYARRAPPGGEDGP
jgi:NhaP-type Na+/H+ or K+/H+ antiporter